MKVLHRSESPGGRGTRQQASDIDVTIAAHGQIARIKVHVDHSYSFQSYAYAKLVSSGETIMQYTGAACGDDPKVVAADLISKSECALRVLAGEES